MTEGRNSQYQSFPPFVRSFLEATELDAQLEYYLAGGKKTTSRGQFFFTPDFNHPQHERIFPNIDLSRAGHRKNIAAGLRNREVTTPTFIRAWKVLNDPGYNKSRKILDSLEAGIVVERMPNVRGPRLSMLLGRILPRSGICTVILEDGPAGGMEYLPDTVLINLVTARQAGIYTLAESENLVRSYL